MSKERYVITAIDKEKREVDVELWDWSRHEGKKPRKLTWTGTLPANWPELHVGTQVLVTLKYKWSRVAQQNTLMGVMWNPAKTSKKRRIEDLHTTATYSGGSSKITVCPNPECRHVWVQKLEPEETSRVVNCPKCEIEVLVDIMPTVETLSEGRS